MWYFEVGIGLNSPNLFVLTVSAFPWTNLVIAVTHSFTLITIKLMKFLSNVTYMYVAISGM